MLEASFSRKKSCISLLSCISAAFSTISVFSAISLGFGWDAVFKAAGATVVDSGGVLREEVAVLEDNH